MDPDAAFRKQQVEHTHKCIEIAYELGVPCIRLNSGRWNTIKDFNDLMKGKFDYKVKYFRRPHGRFNLKTNGILKELDLKCVMWNLLSYDYEKSIDKVKYAIDNYLKENSIIVFHHNIKCDGIIEESLNYTSDQE